MNQEVTPHEFSVHGVAIYSRDGKLSEIIQMMSFLQEVRAKNCIEAIQRIDYDSNSCYCEFTFNEGFENVVKDKSHPILLAALNHISQFDWDGEARQSFASEKAEQETHI